MYDNPPFCVYRFCLLNMSMLRDERILLGVCGSIAVYKAADLVRRLREAGAEVRVAMTDNAQRFVGAVTFQALSGQPVRSSLWDEAAEAAMGHLELARWASRVLIAPASADVIARLAHGFADDLLTSLCLATTAPIAIAPAMNHRMWEHPATQANVAALCARGVEVLGPAEGPLAEGESGPGRLLEPNDIVAALVDLQGRSQQLAGRRVLISAGPTFEDLDPVRFLGNRSSGKMGFALAAAAVAMGAQVTLITGPVALPTPGGARRIDVRSVAQMRQAVLGALAQGTEPIDMYFSTAAVADYAPAAIAPHKLKKSAETLTLELRRTPDILAEVAAHPHRPRLVVGFAAETQNLDTHARGKLVNKKLDLIAANLVGGEGCAFECDDNALNVLWPGGEREIARASKREIAHALLALALERLQANA